METTSDATKDKTTKDKTTKDMTTKDMTTKDMRTKDMTTKDMTRMEVDATNTQPNAQDLGNNIAPVIIPANVTQSLLHAEAFGVDVHISFDCYALSFYTTLEHNMTVLGFAAHLNLQMPKGMFIVHHGTQVARVSALERYNHVYMKLPWDQSVFHTRRAWNYFNLWGHVAKSYARYPNYPRMVKLVMELPPLRHNAYGVGAS